MKKKTDNKTKAVKKTEVSIINPQMLIQQGIQGKASIEVMERLFNLQERWEKNQAKKIYDQAMVKFQAECPIIQRVKDGAKTRAGEIAFKYAPLEVIVKTVKPFLAKYELDYNFKPVKNEAGEVVAIRCYAYHIGGHSDYSEMAIGKGGGTPLMSSTQVDAANLTFAKRYAFNNIFGIVTEEEDNEKILQKAGVAGYDEVNKALKDLDKCQKDDEVINLWKCFSKNLRANESVIDKTKEMRASIKDANEQENEK